MIRMFREYLLLFSTFTIARAEIVLNWNALQGIKFMANIFRFKSRKMINSGPASHHLGLHGKFALLGVKEKDDDACQIKQLSSMCIIYTLLGEHLITVVIKAEEKASPKISLILRLFDGDTENQPVQVEIEILRKFDIIYTR